MWEASYIMEAVSAKLAECLRTTYDEGYDQSLGQKKAQQAFTAR